MYMTQPSYGTTPDRPKDSGVQARKGFDLPKESQPEYNGVRAAAGTYLRSPHHACCRNVVVVTITKIEIDSGRTDSHSPLSIVAFYGQFKFNLYWF